MSEAPRPWDYSAPTVLDLPNYSSTLTFPEGDMMNSRYLLAIAQSIVVAVSCGCASGPNIAPPEVPQALRPPAGQALFIETLASGVQIYECAPKTNQPTTFEWTFRAPEASLPYTATYYFYRVAP